MSRHVTMATILKHWRQRNGARVRREARITGRQQAFAMRRRLIHYQVKRETLAFLVIVVVYSLGFATGAAMFLRIIP